MTSVRLEASLMNEQDALQTELEAQGRQHLSEHNLFGQHSLRISGLPPSLRSLIRGFCQLSQPASRARGEVSGSASKVNS
jgi:hypothetical protein